MTTILLLILIFSSLLYFKKPKHNRDWRLEQSELPTAKIEGNKIFIKNIRNFSYKSKNDFKLNYYNKTFIVDNLKSIDLVLQPFKRMPLIAHVFLSFGFSTGEYISVSIEARRKKKKGFSFWKGFFRSFELIYVIADDADMMRLRPLYHKDKVYVYPLKFKKEKIQKIFLDIMNKVNKIEKNPEFYNTLLNSCVNNTLNHLKKGGDIKMPKTWRVLLPAKLDKMIYDLDMMKTKLSFEKIKDTFLINKKAEKYKDEGDYSSKIRN